MMKTDINRENRIIAGLLLGLLFGLILMFNHGGIHWVVVGILFGRIAAEIFKRQNDNTSGRGYDNADL